MSENDALAIPGLDERRYMWDNRRSYYTEE